MKPFDIQQNASPDIHHIYVSRYDGGRGKIHMEMTFKIKIVGLHQYLVRSLDDWMRQLVLKRMVEFVSFI